MIHIDRCYCFGVTFAALCDVRDRTGADTIEDLQAEVTFGRQCQLCHPYVQRALETGQTVFHEIIESGLDTE